MAALLAGLPRVPCCVHWCLTLSPLCWLFSSCSKAPIQAFADRVSAVFVPIVAVLALLTWLMWYLAGTLHWYPPSWLPQASRQGGWHGSCGWASTHMSGRVARELWLGFH